MCGTKSREKFTKKVKRKKNFLFLLGALGSENSLKKYL